VSRRSGLPSGGPRRAREGWAAALLEGPATGAYAPTAGERVPVVRRLGQLFLGKRWDFYAQEVLSSSPI
jgi:hypothetical protein